jgi:hypothetical protein
MKWSDMSTEERDRLMHTRVMSGSIGKCAGTAYYTGRIGEDEWYCDTCKNYYYDIEEDGKHDMPIPSYSTDMNAAWQIVECKKFAHIRIEIDRTLPDVPQKHLCQIVMHEQEEILPHPLQMRRKFICSGKTSQEAICLTALKACGVEVES